jgi:hypothetical protein
LPGTKRSSSGSPFPLFHWTNLLISSPRTPSSQPRPLVTWRDRPRLFLFLPAKFRYSFPTIAGLIQSSILLSLKHPLSSGFYTHRRLQNGLQGEPLLLSSRAIPSDPPPPLPDCRRPRFYSEIIWELRLPSCSMADPAIPPHSSYESTS